jgi:hypothetical protein
MSSERAGGGSKDIPIEQHSSQEADGQAEAEQLAHAGVAIKT